MVVTHKYRFVLDKCIKTERLGAENIWLTARVLDLQKYAGACSLNNSRRSLKCKSSE